MKTERECCTHGDFLIKKVIVIFFTLAISLNFAQNSDNSGWHLHKKFTNYLRRVRSETINNFYFKANTNEKIVALTFDDGPLANSEKIVNYLKSKNIHASFFLVCNNLNAQNSSIYDSELFELGMHSNNHDHFSGKSKNFIESDLNKCIEDFNNYDLTPDFFRPPYGEISSNLLELLDSKNIKGLLWSIDSYDWCSNDESKIIQNVIKNLDPGAIILIHDQISVNTLDLIVKAIINRGFRIVSLSQLLRSDTDLPILE